MDAKTSDAQSALTRDWPLEVFNTLKDARVSQISYVPDAGHSKLIELFLTDPDAVSTVLTTEEEGIGLAAGAWLGGQRSVLLMQSSGVGNCINMLSLAAMARFPLLMLVTMRGEWAEFNPWQVPMGQATETALQAMGVHCLRADTPQDLLDMAESSCTFAFEAEQQIAILISQRMLGKKKW